MGKFFTIFVTIGLLGIGGFLLFSAGFGLGSVSGNVIGEIFEKPELKVSSSMSHHQSITKGYYAAVRGSVRNRGSDMAMDSWVRCSATRGGRTLVSEEELLGSIFIGDEKEFRLELDYDGREQPIIQCEAFCDNCW